MIRVESAADRARVAQVYEAGQEQVFDHWEELDAAERRSLLAQIATIDLPEFVRLLREGLDGKDAGPPAAALAPAEMIPLRPGGERGAEDGRDPERSRAHEAGLELLACGEVGVFLVAGGQGTRLGFEGPKGCFPLLPITGASLFQHFAEKIAALGRRVSRPIPWFIMTSPGNDAATREFFRARGHFGLDPEQIRFRPQSMLPVVDPRHGKILLASPSELLLGPSGHGGAVRVMQELRDDFERLGVTTLFYHQVDNPLVAMADPHFLGHHRLRGSHFSSKAVAKSDPEEKVGVFCRDGERMRVVEYTELGTRERHERDREGRLAFRAGNIATHAIAIELVAGAEPFRMPYHIARKAVRHLVGRELVASAEPNSLRFESFIFDLLPHARNPIVLEADRAREFAPLKNAEGENSPASTRRALVRVWAEWLEGAGVEIPRDDAGEPLHPIEISPLVADSAEELSAALEGRSVDPRGPILLR